MHAHLRVIFDGTDVTLANVIFAAGLPVRGVLYDANLYPVTREAKRDTEDERIWIVKIGFVNPKPNDKKDQPDGATKYNVQISGSSVPYEEETHVDKNGNIITNTNGEPFNPPLTKVRYDLQVNCSYFVLAPDWATIDGCVGKSNSAAVTLTINGSTRSFATNTLKLDSYTWSADVDSKQTKVVQIQLVLLYRVDTWQYKVPNKSFYKKVSGELKPILYDDLGTTLTDGNPLKGQPIAEPAYLSSAGAVLAAGATAYLVPVDIIVTTSFASLLSEIST